MSSEKPPSHRHHGHRAWYTAVFQGLLALAASAPLIYTAITSNKPDAAVGGAAVVLGAAAALTRIMAIPAVDRLLRVALPHLASMPELSPTEGDSLGSDGWGGDGGEPEGGEYQPATETTAQQEPSDPR